MASVRRNLLITRRALRKRPGFAAVVIASLALGVAAVCVTLRMSERLLLRPLAVHDAGRLAAVGLHWEREGEDDALSYPAFRRYAESAAVRGLAAFSDLSATLGGEGSAEPLDGMLVSPGFFALLGVAPVHGRAFAPGEEDAPLAVLSWELWRRRFGSDTAVLGRAIRLNDQPYTVVGVAPPSFRGLRLAEPVEFWVPIGNLPRIATGFMAAIPVLELDGVRWLDAVARLPEDSEAPAVAEALTGLARSIETSSSRDVGRLRVELTPLPTFALGRDTRDEVASFLRLLGVVVLLELGITCFNLAALFVARGLEERRSAAIRFSLGAPRATFVHQTVLEAVLLALAGAVAGLALAALILRWIGGLELAGIPSLQAAGLGLTPAYAVAACLAALLLALLLALPVAWRLGRLRPTDALKDSAPRAGSSRIDLRRALIAGQVALAVLLLAATALLARSLGNAWSTDPGFRAREVVATSLNLGVHGYEEARARNLFAAVRERLAAGPAVAAAWSSSRPLGPGRIEMGFEVEGRAPGGDERLQAPALVVSPGFFETLGVAIEEGRPLTESDREDSAPVAVVNRAFAERYWPGAGAVGRRISLPGSDLDRVEVVGVAADFDLGELSEDPQPALILPLAQHFDVVGLSWMHLLVRADGATDTLGPVVRRTVESLDPALRVATVETLDSTIRRRFLPQQVGAAVLAFLSVFAVVMVASGVYGVLAGYVAQSTREIGVRMALGADRRTVARLVAVNLLIPVIGGLLAGVAAAALLLRLIASLLFGVDPTDAVSLLAASLLVGAIALLAGFLPARRAMRIPPAQALRWS